jgi:hypothetical protein
MIEERRFAHGGAPSRTMVFLVRVLEFLADRLGWRVRQLLVVSCFLFLVSDFCLLV